MFVTSWNLKQTVCSISKQIKTYHLRFYDSKVYKLQWCFYWPSHYRACHQDSLDVELLLCEQIKLETLKWEIVWHSIFKQQVSTVSVYCDRVGCHVLCLQHVIQVWQYIGISITATSRHRRDMTLHQAYHIFK